MILLDNVYDAFKEISKHYFGPQVNIQLDSPTAVEYAPNYSSSISFKNQNLQGTVTLATDAWASEQLAGPRLADVTDWLGELCNQLAGRLKNRLRGYGQTVTLGLPGKVTNDELNSLSRESISILQLQVNDQKLSLCFNCLMPDDLELQLDEEADVRTEGSCEMFFF